MCVSACVRVQVSLCGCASACDCELGGLEGDIELKLLNDKDDKGSTDIALRRPR